MRTFGIEENQVFAVVTCPNCGEQIGLSEDQITDALENKRFNFYCSLGVDAEFHPLALKKALEKGLMDRMLKQESKSGK